MKSQELRALTSVEIKVLSGVRIEEELRAAHLEHTLRQQLFMREVQKVEKFIRRWQIGLLLVVVFFLGLFGYFAKSLQHDTLIMWVCTLLIGALSSVSIWVQGAVFPCWYRRLTQQALVRYERRKP